MRRTLQSYHPAVTLLYWLLTMGLSMLLLHPVCLGLSFLAAVCHAACLGGRRNVQLQLKLMLPMMLLTALINPLFNHRGVTILCLLPGGNPLTLESIWYGLAAAGMLGSMICWFLCLSAVETSDRLTCLFGRLIPVLALLLSMTLRYVPRLRQQAGLVHAARQASEGQPRGWIARLRQLGTELTALIGWSMEHAVNTADAMKSRGYGLPGRTAFAIYRFTRQDAAALLVMLLLGGTVIAGMLTGALEWQYAPITIGVWTPMTAAALSAHGLLCTLPLMKQGREELRWRSLRSNI